MDEAGTGSGRKGKKKMTQEGQEKEKEEGAMEVGTEASNLQQKGKKMRKIAVAWLFLSLVMSEDEFSRSVSEMSIGQVSLPDCV